MDEPTALFPRPQLVGAAKFIVKAYPMDIAIESQKWTLPDLKSAIFLAWELACKYPWHQVYVFGEFNRQYASFNALWDYEGRHNVSEPGPTETPNQPA